MKTAEMLAEVTAQIRKDIPRLMELREGCVLEIPQFEDPDKVWTYKIVSKRKEGIKFYYDILSLSSYSFDTLSKTDLGKYTIIGKEPMLNDVLEWLNYIIYEKCIPINDLGYSGMVKQFYIKGDDGSMIFETLDLENQELGLNKNKVGVWDLSSVYLKDQSERIINFLYNLKSF